MAAKKKKSKKVRTPEDVKLIEFINKVAEMCRDCHEAGSPPTHEVVAMEGMLCRIAYGRGYDREHWYGDFS